MSAISNQSDPVCCFVVPRKNRRCKMKIKVGHRYCPEHLLLDKQKQTAVSAITTAQTSRTEEANQVAIENQTGQEVTRIPCPLDPKHSCYAHQLAKHLTKCNARRQNAPSYIVNGVNQRPTQQDDGISLRLADVEDDTILDLVSRIQEAHKSNVGTFPLITESHSVFDESVALLQPEANAGKHLTQNASIVGHILKHGLAAEPANSVFLEFGSGRGQLACWLGAAMSRPFAGTAQFLLIDRTSPRHKQDNKFKDDPQLNFERVRADIADLFLPRHSSVSQRSKAVGIGKHLCGAATDLSLCALSQLGDKFRGVAIALCCHHRCSWSAYVGADFLQDAGFDQRDFNLMKGVSSWATCGLRPSNAEPPADVQTAGGHSEGNLVVAHTPEMQNRYEVMGLDRETRERVGRQCKELIDWGRKKYLEELGLVSQLLYYVESRVSLENVLLIATRPDSAN